MNLKYSIITGRALLIGLIALCVWVKDDLTWEIFYYLLTFFGLTLISARGLLTKAYDVFQREVSPSSKWYHNKYLIYILLCGPGLVIAFFLLWHTPNIRYVLKRQISLAIFILIPLFVVINHVELRRLNNLAYIRVTTLHKSPYPYDAFDGHQLYVVFPKVAPEVFFWVLELGPRDNKERESLKARNFSTNTDYYVFKDIVSFSSQNYYSKKGSLREAIISGLNSPEFWNETTLNYRIQEGDAYAIRTGEKLEHYLGSKEKLPNVVSVSEAKRLEQIAKNKETSDKSFSKVTIEYNYEGSWTSTKDFEPGIPTWQIEKNESTWSPGNVLALYFKNEIINDTLRLIFQYKDGSGRGWPMRLIYPEENSLFAKCYKIGDNSWLSNIIIRNSFNRSREYIVLRN